MIKTLPDLTAFNSMVGCVPCVGAGRLSGVNVRTFEFGYAFHFFHPNQRNVTACIFKFVMKEQWLDRAFDTNPIAVIEFADPVPLDKGPTGEASKAQRHM